MNRSGSLLLAAASLSAALLAATPETARAQNFFERLFGIVPDRPPPPPPTNFAPPPPVGDSGDEPRRAAPPPVQARPVAIKAPSEESVIGRDLKQNGTNGTLRLERQVRGGDMRVKLVLPGRRSAQSVETCTIPIGGQEGAALVSLGRPEGTPRYQLQDPVCPLQIDVLDEAVMVKGPAEICTFEALSCQSDPTGIWGPDPSGLVGRARDFESARASSDKAVRDNYKVLVQRARPEGVRPIVAEQAAFSADREMMCRSYAREGQTSFCNAKFTEARALALGTRLGVTTTASVTPAEGRPRRSRSDPYSLPSSDEIMQRRGAPVDDD